MSRITVAAFALTLALCSVTCQHEHSTSPDSSDRQTSKPSGPTAYIWLNVNQVGTMSIEDKNIHITSGASSVSQTECTSQSLFAYTVSYPPEYEIVGRAYANFEMPAGFSVKIKDNTRTICTESDGGSGNVYRRYSIYTH